MAYADFVTAMMAFFLVMWICGQDQKIKRAVADYFSDPLATSKTGGSKKAQRTGSLFEHLNAGTVPSTESVAMGRGRNSYTFFQEERSRATKLVSDWLHTDVEASEYWWKQAQSQREQASWSKEADKAAAYQAATQRLAKQMRDEITRGIPSLPNSLYRDLLFEVLSKVNWTETAEDLLAH